MRGNNEVLKYIPDNWDSPKKADRKFVVAVLSTLYPDFMMELGDDVKLQRLQLREMKATKVEEVNISDDWLIALHRCSFIPCKYPAYSLLCLIFDLFCIEGPIPKFGNLLAARKKPRSKTAAEKKAIVDAGKRNIVPRV